MHFDANIWTYVTAENSDQGKKLLNSLRYERVSDFIQENNQVSGHGSKGRLVSQQQGTAAVNKSHTHTPAIADRGAGRG